MAKELRPPEEPLPPAAIGRPPSRIPVIIRSHEGSQHNVGANQRAGIKYAQFFVHLIDIERHYFSRAQVPSPMARPKTSEQGNRRR
jgi:hypothetical protein